MRTENTIFISAYRNFSIRYILYSDIFKVLKKSGLKIVIFVKDRDLGYYQEKLGYETVTVEPVLYDNAIRMLKKNRLNRYFVILRKLMSGNTPEFENTTRKIRFYQYRQEMSRGLPGWFFFQMIKFLAVAGNKIPVIRQMLTAIESTLFSGKIYDHYFKKYKPNALIVSSVGYMIDPYFMRAAKRHGCKVISIVHNWDNPSGKDYRGANPDLVIAWNDIMKRELNIFHDIPDKRIHVGGIAHWDFYFNGRFKPGTSGKFMSSNKLNEERKVLLYGTSGFKHFQRTFDVIEELLIAIHRGRFIHPCQLLVRLHPSYFLKDLDKKDKIIDRFRKKIDDIGRNYKEIISFAHPVIKVLDDDIDMPNEDMLILADLLFHADILLTEYSTLMIEGAIMDTPVINVGLYNFRNTEKPASYLENFTHIKRILKYNASRNAYKIEQLIEYINFYLKDGSRDHEKRKSLVKHEVNVNKGFAGKAIGQFLLAQIFTEMQEG